MENNKNTALWIAGTVVLVVACSALLSVVDVFRGSREQELAALSMHTAPVHAASKGEKKAQKLYDIPSFTEERTRMSFPAAETDWLDRAAAGQIGDDEKSEEDVGNLTAIISEWRERARNETRAAREEAKEKALESYVDYNVSKGRAIHKIFGKEEERALLMQEERKKTSAGALASLAHGMQKLFGGEQKRVEGQRIVWPGEVRRLMGAEKRAAMGKEETSTLSDVRKAATKFGWPDKKSTEMSRAAGSLAWPRRKGGKERFVEEGWSWPDQDSLSSGWLWPQTRMAARRSPLKERKTLTSSSSSSQQQQQQQQHTEERIKSLAWPAASRSQSTATKEETSSASETRQLSRHPPLLSVSDNAKSIRGFGSSLTWPATSGAVNKPGAGAGAGGLWARTEELIIVPRPPHGSETLAGGWCADEEHEEIQDRVQRVRESQGTKVWRAGGGKGGEETSDYFQHDGQGGGREEGKDGNAGLSYSDRSL
uniref:Uncharacterized protein n=1 Tax=Hanusia phi TaxID=3032 RepID=A0A7S0EZ72_9CRYP|mmetsp:Transcript_33645/g.75589  ORF Transcript_33645/g.75589 Transcript_33645/m.75589 type:complete len:483 (+) Transcript_33645:71-1519(+)